jgi:outer membrane immunogenic protein
VKVRLIASVAFLAATAIGPAHAAPAYDWSGCYVGIAGGGNWGSSQVFYENPSSVFVGRAETNSINLLGGLFGGTTGCSFQVSGWVLGVENDISWTDKSGTAGTIFPLPFNPLTSFQTKETWLDTLRGRFGYAWDRCFFFGTGGGAFAGEHLVPCNPLTGCTDQPKSVVGWTAGLGAEYTFWAHFRSSSNICMSISAASPFRVRQFGAPTKLL